MTKQYHFSKKLLTMALSAALLLTTVSPLLPSTTSQAILTNVSLSKTLSASASSLTVTQAIQSQTGTTNSVQGYIVGQPLSATQVLKSGFNSDTAIAIADTATETNASKMLYVQIPSQFRSQFGLASQPTLMRKSIKLSGSLTAYFSHAGLKNVTTAELITNPTDPGNTSPGTITPSPYDSNYYKSAIGLTGTALKSQLHTIIKGHTALSYDAVWDALRATDEDPKNPNNVILLYTGRSQSKFTNGPNPNDWNREHVWAKSHGNFGTATGAGTDLHHLRPTDVSVNANRGNLDFDMGGVRHNEATECFYDSDSWEPRNSVKGDVARMLFYMAVRYEGTNGEVDLELNNKVNNGSDPFFGKLSVLLSWNAQDPVDAFEMKRNNIIFEKYQKNRNPFIDHPEWAKSIWGN